MLLRSTLGALAALNGYQLAQGQPVTRFGSRPLSFQIEQTPHQYNVGYLHQKVNIQKEKIDAPKPFWSEQIWLWVDILAVMG
jgi:hypothetical protein